MSEEEEAKLQVPEWKLARNGIELMINNKTEEAETFFKQHLDSLQIHAGYSCTLFMVTKTPFLELSLQQIVLILVYLLLLHCLAENFITNKLTKIKLC